MINHILNIVFNTPAPKQGSNFFKDYGSVFISSLALIVSSISLIFSAINNRRTTYLNIKKEVFNTAIAKAKDCNKIWDEIRKNETPGQESYKEQVINEMVISMELITKALTLLSAKSIVVRRDNFAYVFWKQLNTDLRYFFCTKTFINAGQKYESSGNTVYGYQVLHVNEFINSANENPVAEDLVNSLKKLLSGNRTEKID